MRECVRERRAGGALAASAQLLPRTLCPHCHLPPYTQALGHNLALCCLAHALEEGRVHQNVWEDDKHNVAAADKDLVHGARGAATAGCDGHSVQVQVKVVLCVGGAPTVHLARPQLHSHSEALALMEEAHWDGQDAVAAGNTTQAHWNRRQ